MTLPPFSSEPPMGGVAAADPAEGAGSPGTLAPRTAPPPSSGSLDGASQPSEPDHAVEALEAESILPTDAEWGDAPSLLHTEYSPKLQELLAAAARELQDDAGPSSSLPPVDDGAVALAPELLALLDEPLFGDDEASEAGGPSHERGTSSPGTGSLNETGVSSPGETGAGAERAEEGEASSRALGASRFDSPAEALAAVDEDPEGDARPSLVSSVRPAPAANASAAPPRPLELPTVLGEGDAVVVLARAIAGRASGALVLSAKSGARRIMLHDGDLVTVASELADETLLAFLVARGDLERELARQLAGKLPAFGRHAGAALVGHGHLTQDELWPALRDHAEWILGRALAEASSTCELESEPLARYRAEPGVFGGAAGAEIFVELVRRFVPRDVAVRRLGGRSAVLSEGPRRLLGECALSSEHENALWGACGQTVGEVLGDRDDELAIVLYAIVSLGALAVSPPARASGRPELPAPPDPLDDEAIRMRVRARMALVEDGDYFALLGVSRAATSYEIRRAYVALRRTFEPARLLTLQTADLAADVRLIAEVIDEAFEILRDPPRRERYRRAIETSPP